MFKCQSLKIVLLAQKLINCFPYLFEHFFTHRIGNILFSFFIWTLFYSQNMLQIVFLIYLITVLLTQQLTNCFPYLFEHCFTHRIGNKLFSLFIWTLLYSHNRLKIVFLIYCLISQNFKFSKQPPRKFLNSIVTSMALHLHMLCHTCGITLWLCHKCGRTISQHLFCALMNYPCLFCPSDNLEHRLALPTRSRASVRRTFLLIFLVWSKKVWNE